MIKKVMFEMIYNSDTSTFDFHLTDTPAELMPFVILALEHEISHLKQDFLRTVGYQKGISGFKKRINPDLK